MNSELDQVIQEEIGMTKEFCIRLQKNKAKIMHLNTEGES